MSDGQKYHLKKHFKPHEQHIFPVQQHKGKKRSFQIKWLTEFQWLVFSPKIQGGFCIACALFAKEEERKHLGQLVNKPFVN